MNILDKKENTLNIADAYMYDLFIKLLEDHQFNMIDLEIFKHLMEVVGGSTKSEILHCVENYTSYSMFFNFYDDPTGEKIESIYKKNKKDIENLLSIDPYIPNDIYPIDNIEKMKLITVARLVRYYDVINAME